VKLPQNIKMATEETLRIFSKDCNEDYCSIREFFRRKSEEHPFANINCSGCQGDRDYCEARRAISQIEDRVLFQFKELEMFKFFESKTQERDIGWNEAVQLWVRRGYAARFSKLYDTEGIRDPQYVFSSYPV